MKVRSLPEFIPGLRLSELFYREAISPILESNFPKVRHSAGLLGPGSEVLGLDTIRSTDHHWGPRLQIFLSEDDYRTQARPIDKALSKRLPQRFHGYSTSFGPPDRKGVRLMKNAGSGPVSDLVEISTIESFFESYLGVDPNSELKVIDWLTIPEQRLLSVTTGRVFHDGLGLNHVQQKFAYYPRDVWLYLLAAQWTSIAEEEAFIGRTGEVGDELGSRIIAARLVRALMKLCFLMARQYAPYSKWFGTSFAQLTCSKRLVPVFENVLGAESWHEREKYLSKAYSHVARMHNALCITRPLDTHVSPFYHRPYKVIHSEQFASEIRKAIRDEDVRKIKVSIGSVDQFVDSTDIMTEPRLYRRLGTLFDDVPMRKG
jgi:Domain of unknown function (DUF4037)